MAISVLVGAVVAYLSSRFRRKNIAQTIMLLLIVGGCFALGFSSSMGLDYTVMIKRIYFVLPLMIDTLWAWGDLLVVVAVNLLPYIAVMLVVAVTYS